MEGEGRERENRIGHRASPTHHPLYLHLSNPSSIRSSMLEDGGLVLLYIEEGDKNDRWSSILEYGNFIN